MSLQSKSEYAMMRWLSTGATYLTDGDYEAIINDSGDIIITGPGGLEVTLHFYMGESEQKRELPWVTVVCDQVDGDGEIPGNAWCRMRVEVAYNADSYEQEPNVVNAIDFAALNMWRRLMFDDLPDLISPFAEDFTCMGADYEGAGVRRTSEDRRRVQEISFSLYCASTDFD